MQPADSSTIVGPPLHFRMNMKPIGYSYHRSWERLVKPRVMFSFNRGQVCPQCHLDSQRTSFSRFSGICMSVVGENQAFISIGVSCQTAQQLQRHAAFLSLLLNDKMVERSGFFNWVFVSASDIAKVVDRLLSAPITPNCLYVPTHAREALRLEDFKVWLWHEKFSGAVTQDDVTRIATKYERLRNNFLKMLETPVRYIVLSNTQNNLENFYPYKNQGMNISFNAEIVSEIARAPWATNQYGSAEIITVSYPRRWSGKAHPSVAYLEEDDSVWEGDFASWDKALQRHSTRVQNNTTPNCVLDCFRSRRQNLPTSCIPDARNSAHPRAAPQSMRLDCHRLY